MITVHRFKTSAKGTAYSNSRRSRSRHAMTIGVGHNGVSVTITEIDGQLVFQSTDGQLILTKEEGPKVIVHKKKRKRTK